MSLAEQTAAVPVDEAPRWALAPRPVRVDGIDQALRGRLADSLHYLGEIGSLDPSRQAALLGLERKLRTTPVSPWVFCLYSKLVAEISKHPRGDVAQVFDGVVRTASLPTDEGVVALRNPAVSAFSWDHFLLLLDTDRQRPFKPQAPSPEAFSLCKQDIEAGLTVMRRADPIWYEEVLRLLRMIVLGAPASPDSKDLFNGASTFFLWGATLLNADLRRSAISIVDLLVHESSHVLLFGLSAEGALTRNRGDQRYASPLRSDARPIDGIFHGCFVATRVHLAMSRMLASGRLTADEAKQAVERRKFNGEAAGTALDVLDRNADPTELGENILATIRAHLADNAVG
jgi:HEXXH motif-containing protein